MSSPSLRIGAVLLLLACSGQRTNAQMGWQLDTTFRMPYSPWFVNDIHENADGSLFLSGQIHFPEDEVIDPIHNRSLAHVFADGSIDSDFPDFPYTAGGGRLTPWSGKIYVASSGVKRLYANGLIDSSFVPLYDDSRVSLGGGGGDFLVYPDGSLLVAMLMGLNDPINGFVGNDYQLIWFTNTGALDTTKVHRRSNSLIHKLAPQADGRILCSAYSTTFEGHPVGRIFRILPDGSWDPSLATTINAGSVFQFVPLDDGRFYAVGHFRFAGHGEDWRYIVRFMPDGTLDPSFQNNNEFTWPTNTTSLIAGLFPIEGGKFIAYGSFTHVNGIPQKALCVIDSTGAVIDGYFNAPNCGDFVYQGMTHGGISGIKEAANGDLYIYGDFKGYNDGVVNDPGQNLISRLKRVDTGAHVEQLAEREQALRIYPNPASTWLVCEVNLAHEHTNALLYVTDALGRTVLTQAVANAPGSTLLNLQGLQAGIYTVDLSANGNSIQRTSFAIQ